jgi:hypothetical protein
MDILPNPAAAHPTRSAQNSALITAAQSLSERHRNGCKPAPNQYQSDTEVVAKWYQTGVEPAAKRYHFATVLPSTRHSNPRFATNSPDIDFC